MNWVAGILSTLWFAAIALYLTSWKTGIAAIDRILTLEPNNFGDFMSGAFAPVAFFWLMYSVVMQKQELNDTRKVLEDQKTALEKSAASSDNLINLTQKQIINQDFSNRLNAYEVSVRQFYRFCETTIPVIYYFGDGYSHLYLCNIHKEGSKTNKSPFEIIEIVRNFIQLKNNNKLLIDDDKNIKFKNVIKTIILMIGTMREIVKGTTLEENFFAEGFKDLYEEAVGLLNSNTA